MTRDDQTTPPLECLTHKGRDEGYGVLAPVECYTTVGVIGWQSKNNGVLSNDAELFSHQKRIRNFSFLPCDFRPRRKKEARVSVLCLTQTAGSPTNF